ncbi:glycosyltransferase family A protein [Cryobacterium sp. Y11]|uniref:glycosyltransferase family A protein n=1 Tax=Cryobacterium sp. Y11 TaxID=2045016 RepID=UPI000CE48169|nr:glycosyltransferase family 2 protein [Cryobacterium sp. Y11]
MLSTGSEQLKVQLGADGLTSSSDHNVHTSTIDTLLGELMSGPHLDPDLRYALDSVRGLISAEDRDAPFLTVLLRTQGKRPEPLKDALLCLAAQTDQDFEIIVIDHDADLEGAEVVRNAIAEQPIWMADRISRLEVRGGNRAKPLNAGIHAATGRYVAVFDDDDLLFANWVEAFRTASQRSSGRMLRALAANQAVTPELWPQDQIGFRTISWPKADYPREFDQIAHLGMNYSPFMSWAFPSTLFRKFGFEFDEELTVCEDWDMILRGSLLLGVENVDVLTAIYRKWKGGQSSYTDHSRDSWAWSEAKVVQRINDSVLIMPGGFAPFIRHAMTLRGAHEQLGALLQSRAWRYSRPVRGALRVAGYTKRRIRRLLRRT